MRHGLYTGRSMHCPVQKRGSMCADVFFCLVLQLFFASGIVRVDHRKDICTGTGINPDYHEILRDVSRGNFPEDGPDFYMKKLTTNAHFSVRPWCVWYVNVVAAISALGHVMYTWYVCM